MPRFSFKNVVQLTKKQLDKKKIEANRQLQDNNNALKKSIKAMEDEAKEAKSKMESVAYEVKTASRQKQGLSISLSKLQKKQGEAESILADKQSKLDGISNKAEEIGKDINDRDKRLKTLNKAIDQANAVKPDIIKLKEELKSANQELMKKKLDLDDLSSQEGILKDRVKNIASEYNEKTKPYEKTLDKAKEKQASLLRKYKEEVKALENETKETQGVIEKHKNTLKGYEREIVAAKSLFNDETEKVKDTTDQVKQLEREKAMLMRDIADKKKRYDGWTVKAMEDVAKLKLKGRLENIDKAGLKDNISYKGI